MRSAGPRAGNRIGSLFALGALALTMLPSPTKAVAGIEMDCGGSVRALALQGYDCYCSGGQLLCRGGKGVSAAAGMKAMIATTVVESLVTAIFAPPASSQRDSLAEQQKAAELAAQYLAQKKAREAEEQAAFERMMSSYKQLEGAAAVDYKALSNTSLSFKILDGDQEGLAGNARQPFDTPAGYKMLPPPAPTGGATAFFGDTMPTEAIQLLVKPENNPKVVDLRKAITFVAENLKTDGEKLAAATLQTQKTKGKQPAAKTADCRKLAQRLSGYVEQRNKFHKTILLAQDQLNTWQDANRNALVNAAKDGVEYFVGIYLEILKNRGLAADRLRGIFEKRAAEMARNGLDIRDIEAKIARLKALSSIGKFSDVANSANDWQTFIKDGMSGLVNQLTDSNDEIKGMLGDPGMQKYFTADAPELNALLDISKMAASGKVLGKWVAKQMPIIAMLELSVKQLYNATDWCLSFQQIAESNRINGEVMKAARSLQRDIDATYASLQQCP